MLGELVELGRRLTEQQLEKMRLLEDVVKAEQEYYWRMKAIADLMRDCTGAFRGQIEKELALAKRYAFEPKRDGSRFFGRNTRVGEKRIFDEPGTLIFKKT